MKQLVMPLLILALAAIACGGGGGTDLSSCVDVEVSRVEAGMTITDVFGTVTNNCDKRVTSAKIVATCFTASGLAIGSDEEYVSGLAIGSSERFNAIVEGVAARCSANIDEAH